MMPQQHNNPLAFETPEGYRLLRTTLLNPLPLGVPLNGHGSIAFPVCLPHKRNEEESVSLPSRSEGVVGVGSGRAPLFPLDGWDIKRKARH
ncbi:hypothetical protein CEXT_143821 [Caerostris extrusa]|uniref:Uncharacterized protein n=1 Tax=Caerostris extrusa TaxID=172846 RepID=A0AAV4Y1A5_CAEEX|nr:hypothetical protein CEXT_143821 [Caerostris extrusa]